MKDVDIIIEKYFKGTSTLADEEKLKNYLLSTNVDEKHKYLVSLFEFYKTENTRNSILIPEFRVRKNYKIVKWLVYTSVAASVVLVFSIYQKTQDVNFVVMNGQRIQNSELAMQIATQKLSKVNDMLQKNLQPLENLRKVKSTLQSYQYDFEQAK